MAQLQEEYYSELAELGGIEPIKPYILKIYNQDNAFKMNDYVNSRKQTFQILSDDTYTSGFL